MKVKYLLLLIFCCTVVAFKNCTKAIAINPKDYRAHVLLGYI